MIRAYVSDDTAGYAVRIAIVDQRDDQTAPSQILRIADVDDLVGTVYQWVDLQPHVEAQPTLCVPGDIARALLDGLSRHYHGAEDTRALRRDYDDERKRVDKLTDALIAVAGELAGAVGE